MYESAFGFRLRPFTAAPIAALYYPASTIEKARNSLARCVEHGGGPGLVVGPAGVGKTLLCQLLADQFQERFRVVVLASARLCTRRALLQNILFELGLPYRDLEEGELRLSLIDFLANDDRAAGGMLLIVDEAHTLPTRLLEEIRLITNLVRDGRPRVRLILAGSARLEERFASPKLESFNQRIAARCYLESLGREETKAYIASQVRAAGRNVEEVFPDDAQNAVFDATGGVPRLINQLCDHALVLAAAGGRRRIDANGIQEAWTDLQQLPAPWNYDSEPKANVVEFGRLDQAEGMAPPREKAEVAANDDPLDRLADIEGALATAAADRTDEVWSPTITSTEADEDEQFQPAGVIGPEVELVFHGPHAPFGEGFAEEEIVIDRYAALESAQLAKLRQTPWSRDRQIPELVAAAESHLAAIHPPTAPPVRGETAEGSPDGEATAADEPARETSVDPATRPLTPEYRTAAPTRRDSEQPASLVALSVHEADDADHRTPRDESDTEDDRDLIVVEDDGGHGPAGPTRPGRVRRQEYRQLFARMRRG